MNKFASLFLIYTLFVSQVFAKDFRFVQITDVRYDKNADIQVLPNVIKEINTEKNVQFVVFTGDNIVKPDKEQLKAFLSEVKKLNRPFYIVAGDKDLNKRRELGKKEYANYIKKTVRGHKYDSTNYIFMKNGLVFIVVDGAKDVIPSTIGYYKDNTLEWIDANLDLYANKNVIILQHFPIVPPSKRESHYTYKADKYLEVIKKHPNVKAIVTGHFGVNKEDIINGVSHISTAPIPYYRVIDVIDYETKNPTIWTEVKEVVK